MTFWQFLTNIWNAVLTHGTRALGALLGTLSVLVGTGIIPENQLKYYAAGIAVLTYWRGQANADTIAAKVAQINSPFVHPPSGETK
jgi:hypothetical protein